MSEVITLPGLVDVHVHLREPGTNLAETIASGTKAALLGGYVLLADMPNNPGLPTWTEERVEQKLVTAEKDSYTYLAVNAGSQPESNNIGQIEGMMSLALALKGYGGKTTGIDRLTDYEGPEFDEIIRELHRVAPDKPFLWHSGKDNLSYMIGLVAKRFNHPLHVCHVNDPAQVELVAKARRNELLVTCGVCPHHLLKTAHNRQTEGKFAEMQPPLASEVDSEKLMSQLVGGDIQIIETDHAPHTKESKWQKEEDGGDCFGVPGIQEAAALMLYQVRRGNLTPDRMIDAMSTQPAALLGVSIGSGTYSKWEYKLGRIESEDYIESGAGWTPYLGMNTGGNLIQSVIGGVAVYNRGVAYRAHHRPVARRETKI